MEFMAPDFGPAMAEIFLACGICVVLIADLFVTDRNRDLTFSLALLTLIGTAWISWSIAEPGQVLTFSGSFVADRLSQLLKMFSIAAVFVVFLYSRDYLRDRDILKGEYYVLGLFALLGIMVMTSAYSMLTMYLGLEMMSLALYAMVAFDRKSPVAAEAAMKYFVLGAIASGTLLYGISFIYGITGSLQIGEISLAVAQGGVDEVSLMIGLAFVLVGIAFKFGAVPFHMWLPDVYHGAPTSVTLFIGTAPKLASIALAYRILVEALGSLASVWEPMLLVMAMLSLAIGNIVAIAQTNIKRMLAYSTIGHVGFILLGFVAGSNAGVEAALFYTIVYVLTAAAAFGIIILMSRNGKEADRLDDLKGLSKRSPWFAAMMLLVMVSMIGVPPLAGFYAKWWVLTALVNSGQVWAAVAAVVFSVIGAFYYLRVIRLMYFDDSDAGAPVTGGWLMRTVLSINALAVLALGLFPGGLFEMCARALSG